ncbi:MAG: sugar phosphate isomerase/epimerase family protein [Spirochaetota bacterium]
MAPNIGLIGLGIKDLVDKDPEWVLQWLSQLGLDGIEGAASYAEKLGIDEDELKRKLDGLGLAVPCQGGIKYGKSDDEIRESIATAKTMGAPFVVDYFAPFNDKNEILEYARYYERAGKICADAGVGLLYHNHNQEMARFDGKRGIEILLENTDPTLVNVELDVGWVAFGGGNPVELIEAYPDRFPVLHMKDFESLMPDAADPGAARKEAVFTEVGDGVVDIKGVVAAAKQAGVRWLTIEQDRLNKLGPKESLERSFANLKALVG